MIANAVCSRFQDSSQIELLKELMDLQKDMVVMLLSMLEGTATCTFTHVFTLDAFSFSQIVYFVPQIIKSPL